MKVRAIRNVKFGQGPEEFIEAGKILEEPFPEGLTEEDLEDSRIFEMLDTAPIADAPKEQKAPKAPKAATTQVPRRGR